VSYPRVIAPGPATVVTVASLEPARQAVQEAVEAIVGERPATDVSSSSHVSGLPPGPAAPLG